MASTPLLICSGVNETLKSKLKSDPNDESQLNFQPMRFLNGAISFHGAREMTANVVSRWPRWTFTLSKWSAQKEQCSDNLLSSRAQT